MPKSKKRKAHWAPDNADHQQRVKEQRAHKLELLKKANDRRKD